jgi:hypothetical protein
MSDYGSATLPIASMPIPVEREAVSVPVSRTSSGIVSLAPFLALARELAAEIVPVRLRIEFRDELQRELMAAARQQYARDLLIWSTPTPAQAKTSRRWVLGAATLGLGSAVSLASIVTAFYMRHRHRQAA